MDPTSITYELARCYISDKAALLPDDVLNKLSGWIRSRRYDLLASCVTLLSQDIAGLEVYRIVYQVEAMFKKNRAFTDPVEARLAALVSFEDAEDACVATNNFLDTFYAPEGSFDPWLVDKYSRMERWIDEVLGDIGDFLEQLPELIRVTSGATVTRSRRESMPFLKVSKRSTCSPGALPLIGHLLREFGVDIHKLRVVSENRVTFVPKSWKTERTIACEPEGNLALQLAFDQYAKRRLLRKGINLSDQTRNQELAREGSIYGTLATIDLSQASDTLAYNTVALLLPRRWFQYLRAIRSQAYSMYGFKTNYAKFSSMGNGATFVLETLIFAAACASLRPRTYSVYGDDIIIDADKVEDLLKLLSSLGFKTNQEKTFFTGPFRESCGKYWYCGFDITPVFIRELDSRKTTWCHLVNSLMTVSSPYGELMMLLSRITRELKLPFSPYSESTIGGVWVTPFHAYRAKLIKCSTTGRWAWTPRAKQFVAKTRLVRDFTFRSYFLWHLGAKGRKNAYESSRYYLSSHKYVRKWVHWKPVVGAPEQLFDWSEINLPQTNTLS